MRLKVFGREIVDVSFSSRNPKTVVTGGIPRDRSSTPEDTSFGSIITSARDSLSYMTPQVPVELLDLIARLCLVDSNFAQALSNIVCLGNNGHQVFVTASSNREIRKALTRLTELSTRIQIDGMLNALFRQVGVYGALSMEWVPEKNLSGIMSYALVPVRSIRFKYDSDAERHLPQQYTSQGRYIELNEAIYTYSALENDENSPYGIPPFVTAVPPGIIQLSVMKNLKSVIKKFGLLGFTSLSLEAPVQNDLETSEQYQSRLAGYLSTVAADYTDNFDDGFAVTWDNAEVNHYPIAGDADGSSKVQEMLDLKQMSGLKQDPAMMGRSFSGTETYAGVVYSKMINEMDNYRRLISAATEKGMHLDLIMAGIRVKTLALSFSGNSSFKPKEEAETGEIHTRDLIQQMDAGLISPDQAAQAKGYEAAYLSDFAPDTGGSNKASATLSWDASGRKYRIVREHITVMDLASDDLGSCLDEVTKHVFLQSTETADLKSGRAEETRRLRWFRQYLKTIEGIDSKARFALMAEIKTKLKAGSFAASTAEAFANKVVAYMVKRHPILLKGLNTSTTIAASVKTMFQYYRLKDKVIEKKIRIPFRLNQPDKRAVKFLGELDNFYVSKYLTNPSAQGPILRFLRDEYLEGGHQKVEPFIEKFTSKFANVSKSQMQAIVDTGVSRIRNAGHIRQMATYEIKFAEIMEIMDRLTCPQCNEVDGKRFEVSRADTRLQSLYELSPEEFNETVYQGAPEEWRKGGESAAGYAKGKSGDDLVASNIFVPLHTRCRGTLVAV